LKNVEKKLIIISTILRKVKKMSKKIYRIKEGKKICGVCGGIAEYFDLDPTIVRVVWALLVILAGCGLLAYIIAALLIPEKPDVIE